MENQQQMSTKQQQTTLQKQQNQETQNQQQQFRNPIFLSKQSQNQEQTTENKQQMSEKQHITLPKQPFMSQKQQGTQNQQFRKPTWRPNVYDPFGNFPYYRMDVDQEQEPPEEKQNNSERKSFYYPIF